MRRYKACAIKRDEVIRDINHAAWKTSKTRIIEAAPDNASVTRGAISYSDILFDVDYNTWKTANVRIADAEGKAEAQTDDSNARWFRRHYKVAVEQVIDILRPFILLSRVSVNDNRDNTLEFRFPKQWTGSVTVIMGYVHHFIAEYILSEWYTMTIPDAAATHLTAAETWKGKIIDEAHSEDENYDWFERQLATAVDHLKGRLRWCIYEHTGSITDNTIKTHAIPYGDEGFPETEQDFSTFEDDEAFLDAPKEKRVPIPEHVFRFKFSHEWRGNFESLSNYIHRYIVDYILYEWYKVTLPSEASVYLTSAEAWESSIINEARSEDVRNVHFRL